MESIIRKCSVEPIKKIWVTESLILHVQFENGCHVFHKINAALRMFLVTIQHVKFDRVSQMPCIQSKLGFYDLLGFQVNDVIRANGYEQDMFIQFSGP